VAAILAPSSAVTKVVLLLYTLICLTHLSSSQITAMLTTQLHSKEDTAI